MFDVSYLDDVTFPIVVPHAMQLLPNMEALIVVVIDEISSFGFKVNLKKGKTEAVLKFVGPHSAECRRRVCENGGVRAATGSGTLLVHAAQTYKHMGGVTSPHGQFPPRSSEQGLHCQGPFLRPEAEGF